jgi:hypothetical protein
MLSGLVPLRASCLERLSRKASALTPSAGHHQALAVVAELLPEQRLALAHLFGCPRCRSAATRLLGETVRDELDELTAPARPVAELRRAATGEIGTIFARSAAAMQHAIDLAAMTAEEAGAAIAAQPELRDPLVATSLLFAAEGALEDPAQEERLGKAAFRILEAQDPDLEGRTLSKLCRAAWAMVRGARVQGRTRQAEDAFRRTLPFLALAPPVSEGRAALLAGVAQLRWRERRLDESAALFSLAARIFGGLGERQGEAACRCQAGCVLLEQMDIWRARAELALAHVHLDAGMAPALAARAALMLAWCNFAVGRPQEGRERLRAARGLYVRAPGAGEEAFRSWWEARIAAFDRPGQAGEKAAPSRQADPLLESVRRRLFAEGSIAEAARCTLDLLVLRVEAGELDAISDLGPEVLLHFQNRPMAFRCAAMIDLLAHFATQRSERFQLSLAPTRHYLLGLRTRPPDRPDLIADIQLLADQLLVAATIR